MVWIKKIFNDGRKISLIFFEFRFNDFVSKGMKFKEDIIFFLGIRIGIYGICVCLVFIYNEEC